MLNTAAKQTEKDAFLSRITSDPETLHGKPRIKGTRIAVYMILQMIAGGDSEETILREFPSLTKEDIHASLSYAARLAEYEAYAL